MKTVLRKLVGGSSNAWSSVGSHPPSLARGGEKSLSTVGRGRKPIAFRTLAIALLCAGVMGLLALSAVTAASHMISGPDDKTVLEGPENTPPGTVIATFGKSEEATWGGLEGPDAGDFQFANGVLTTVSDFTPDYETQQKHNVVIVALDDQKKRATHDFTLLVGDVGPDIYGSEGVDIREDTLAEAVIADFNASTEVTWYLANADAATVDVTAEPVASGDGDAGFFVLSRDAGSPSTGVRLKLGTTVVLDYETPADSDMDNVYKVIVVGEDVHSEQTWLPFNIKVTNVGPVIVSSLSGNEVKVEENWGAGRVITRFHSIPSADVTWALAGVDAADLTIVSGVRTEDLSTRGTLAFAPVTDVSANSVPDYENPADEGANNVYEVTVVATLVSQTQQTEKTELAIKVKVTDKGPNILGLGSFTVVEGATANTSLESKGASYSAGAATLTLGGDDMADFTIDNGDLRFAIAPDFEDPADEGENNVYEVTVVATLGSESIFRKVTVTVTDAGPIIDGPDLVTVTENPSNTPAGAVIARYTVTSGSWATLAGPNADNFTFDNGDLKTATGFTPDFEQGSKYVVWVMASDGANPPETKRFEVEVQVLDDYGPEITGPTMVYVDEHTVAGTVIATYTAEAGATWAAALTGADFAAFTFTADPNVATNGSLAINAAPNYEDKASYEVNVVAEEAGEQKALMVTVMVRDVDTGAPAPEPAPAPQTTVTNTVTNTVTRTVYRDRSPAPAPAPAGPSIIGDSGYATTYLAVDGQSIELRIHPQAGGPASHTFAVGSSYVRDADLGQTYQIVAGGKRRWVAPDSPLVYAIPWPVVNSMYTFSSLVVAAIPLDESSPSEGFLVRGQNGRIVSYSMAMWRHVPNIPTFQALGYRWCDVNNADGGFFSRISEGSPHAATSQPADPNYPSCG